ncbi:MAG: glycoside hydrolase family 2 TIM barrel-domain containing protein [Verrucomicrobiales bacterium]|nr:glycoside hydrolase family 2 TIM barrel-domain containing protein [Verrucomicrobiales bacterium]
MTIKPRFISLLALLAGSHLLPAATTPDFGWGREAVEEISARRGRICLNGIWRFMPAEGPAAAAPQGDWGAIPVPGSWDGKAAFPPIVATGQSEAWRGFGRETARVWYERQIHIPGNWAGRAIVLDVRRVSTDATVFVNDTRCGEIAWPAGTVDLTDHVSPGAAATLRLKVVATDNEKEVLNFMGHDQVTTQPARLDSRGLIGEVFLVSRPRGAHVSDVFIQTSTRRNELALDVELRDVPAAGEIALIAEAVNATGSVEKTFRATTPVRAEPVQTIRVAWPWADPTLWDVGQPHLYTLRLKVTGAGLDDELTQTFGFREFWIEGRRFFLNGREIRLWPAVMPHEEWSTLGGSVAGMDGVIAGLLKAGFNFAEHWPFDHDRRGRLHFRELWAERADRAGLLLAGCALSMNPYLSGPNWTLRDWNEGGLREKYLARMSEELRRYRNHPSIVMWATSANFFGHNLDQDPRYLGAVGYGSETQFQRRVRLGLEGIAMIKSVDPTRPVFTHHGAYVGDVHTVNMYLNFIPLQEREEWLSHWVRQGVLPFMPVEFGTPLHSSFMRGRDGFAHSVLTEPLMTEYCAMYLGRDAYRLETPDYRREIAARFEGEQRYKNWQNNPRLEGAPAFQELQSLFIRNTWRAWRTWGITGGMVPWAMAHGWEAGAKGAETVPAGPFVPGHRGTHRDRLRKEFLHYLQPEGTSVIRPAGRTLMEVNGPTLAWIAGPPEAFTAKDHSFQTGETLRKQLVLINDTRAPQPFCADWAVELAGREIARGRATGEIGIAENQFLPISVTLPERIQGERAEGNIVLQATLGDRRHEDAFPFRVFAPAPPAGGTVAVFDPLGETTPLLKSIGCGVEPVTPSARVIVVGRRALSERHRLPFDPGAFVREGGRLLVMAQDPRWMQFALGLRTAPFVTRRVFPVDANHAVVAGLDALDLRDWNGESRLIEPYPQWPNYEGVPLYGWHWGNRGGVTSAAVEKPHRTGWRPLLECEFDLAYTPLMEMEFGRGRITLCTLDLEDHVANDPAARRLARNLLQHVQTAPILPKAEQVVLLGADADAQLLEFLNVPFTRVEALPSTPALVVIGAGVEPDAATLEAFLRGGGRALVLARTNNVELVSNFSGSLCPPPWPECAGLSASDLRWRAEGQARLLKPAPGLELGADGLLGRRTAGKGVAIYCQIDPRALPADTKTYFRFTRWRQTRALSQLLANLGAPFTTDRVFLDLLQHPEHPVFLAGPWQVQLLRRFEEHEDRRPNPDPGPSEPAKRLVQPDAPEDGWETQPVPAYFESYGGAWARADGEAVFRRVIELPPELAGRDLYLSLGRVDESDHTYFNGELIGTTRDWQKPRGYVVPGRLVRAGRNVIALRVYDEAIHGGMCGAPEHLYLIAKPAEKRFYHPDYLDDRKIGDNPYRYYRW